MIYSILKKDKSSLLGICDAFLFNKTFEQPSKDMKSINKNKPVTMSLARVYDTQIICAFNGYLSLINNKKPSKMSCLFNEWDEQMETTLLQKQLQIFSKNSTRPIMEMFKKYLQNSCQSLINYYLHLPHPVLFETQMKSLLLGLKLNKFKGKRQLLELLKQIRNHKLRNPREVIYVLAKQRGVHIEENLLSIVLEVYAAIPEE
jgi:hypothetical protein